MTYRFYLDKKCDLVKDKNNIADFTTKSNFNLLTLCVLITINIEFYKKRTGRSAMLS